MCFLARYLCPGGGHVGQPRLLWRKYQDTYIRLVANLSVCQLMDKRMDKVGVVISFLHLATLKLVLHVLDTSILIRSRKRIGVVCCFLDEPRKSQSISVF